MGCGLNYPGLIQQRKFRIDMMDHLNLVIYLIHLSTTLLPKLLMFLDGLMLKLFLPKVITTTTIMRKMGWQQIKTLDSINMMLRVMDKTFDRSP